MRRIWTLQNFLNSFEQPCNSFEQPLKKRGILYKARTVLYYDDIFISSYFCISLIIFFSFRVNWFSLDFDGVWLPNMNISESLSVWFHDSVILWYRYIVNYKVHVEFFSSFNFFQSNILINISIVTIYIYIF